MTTRTTTTVADSVSELLSQARMAAGLSVGDVSARTKIPERYLSLFEDRSCLAEAQEDAYMKIYLKAYGKFLGFDTVSLTELYRKERARTPKSRMTVPENRHPNKAVKKREMIVTSRAIQTGAMILAALGIAAYLIKSVITIVSPPPITLLAPYEGMITTDRNIAIEGRTEPETILRVNGKPVSPDSNGKFVDTIDLQEGVNTISVVGTKKHSKPMNVTRRVIVLPRNKAVAPVGTTLPEIEEIQ